MEQNERVILVVDDVASNAQLLASILQKNYRTKIALDGATALELVVMDPIPDIILLDIEMPEMNGFEVLQRLKANHATKDIPVIFVTGYDAVKEEERGLLEGAVDYITKPIRPVIVRARINIHLTIKEQRDKLIFAASHDLLSGLYNRRHLTEEGSRRFSSAIRHQLRLSMIMLDIDHFKIINDTYGHLAGDEVIRAVSQVLLQYKRNEDFAARYGGEEFIVLLDNCKIEDAVLKAEQLRKLIESLVPDGIKVTASFGVTELQHSHRSFEEMIKEADEALYHSKENGRNQVSY
ncbi:MAG: diguanylate cyclase [Sulfurimonadaceae bacterium]|jgi:diguanylate cyclase (GGDEF)-like protein|nr:diguanylate cyclase [Sulfurimonadaceae bacterium]